MGLRTLLLPALALLCGLPFGIPETEATAVQCMSGYTLVSDASVCVKVHASKTKTWDAARTKCQKKGADLLTIHSMAAFTALMDSGVLPERQSFWIGMNDKAAEGNYVWLDETTRATFHNLNLHPQYTRQSANQDCILLMTSGNYQWYMQSCHSQLSFICSYNI